MDRQGKKTGATERRHYLTIQSKTSVPDGEGGYTETWIDGVSIFAAVYPIRAQQQFNLRSVNVDATHFVKIEGEIVAAEKDRIKFISGSVTRYFEILTIEDIQERGIDKWVMCKERR